MTPADLPAASGDQRLAATARVWWRHRWVIWSAFAGIIAIDAAVATPIGLSLLYVGPLVLAAAFLTRREVVAMALTSAVSRLLFGPLGDPLGIKQIALQVSPNVQIAASALTSLLGYLAVGLLVTTVFRQRRSLRELASASETDPLTGLANRRALARFMTHHADRAGSVIAVDIDHFKRINDQHGHAGGDRVLVELAQRLPGSVRTTDIVARAGGEEFLVVLPGAPLAAAELLAARIGAVVRERPFQLDDGPLAVTASLGVASGILEPALLGRADEALYRAKNAGRDRYELARADVEPEATRR